MFELVGYEARRRAKGSAALAVLVGAFAVMMVAIFPSIEASGVDFASYAESLPPAVQAAFNIQAITTVEGFLAVEFYQFVWVLLLGLYVAYAAGSTLAGEIESGRIELTLAAPIRRRRVVAEKALAQLAPVLFLSAVTPPVLYLAVLAIGESLPVERLVAAHALGVAYLAACGGIGLLLSAALSRADFAQRGAIGAVFGLFVVDSVSSGTDFSALGALSPTRYYDPTAILVEGTYDLGGALVLSAGALLLCALAAVVFARRDV